MYLCTKATYVHLYVTIRAQKSRQIEGKAIITKNCAFVVCGLTF